MSGAASTSCKRAQADAGPSRTSRRAKLNDSGDVQVAPAESSQGVSEARSASSFSSTALAATQTASATPTSTSSEAALITAAIREMREEFTRELRSQHEAQIRQQESNAQMMAELQASIELIKKQVIVLRHDVAEVLSRQGMAWLTDNQMGLDKDDLNSSSLQQIYEKSSEDVMEQVFLPLLKWQYDPTLRGIGQQALSATKVSEDVLANVLRSYQNSSAEIAAEAQAEFSARGLAHTIAQLDSSIPPDYSMNKYTRTVEDLAREWWIPHGPHNTCTADMEEKWGNLWRTPPPGTTSNPKTQLYLRRLKIIRKVKERALELAQQAGRAQPTLEDNLAAARAMDVERGSMTLTKYLDVCSGVLPLAVPAGPQGKQASSSSAAENASSTAS